MLSCWLIMRPLDKRSHLVLALMSLLVMASLRFNGVVFALAIMAVLLFTVRGISRALVAAAIVMLLLMPNAAAVSPIRSTAEDTGLAHEGTVEFLTQGQVIWDTISIPMPPAGERTGSVSGDLLRYATAHPVAVTRLYLYRLGHYLFAWNPRFSSKHILITTVQWLVAYAFAAIGWLAIRRRGARGFALLPALFIVQAVLVVLTVGITDGRYSLRGAVSFSLHRGGRDRNAGAFAWTP